MKMTNLKKRKTGKVSRSTSYDANRNAIHRRMPVSVVQEEDEGEEECEMPAWMQPNSISDEAASITPTPSENDTPLEDNYDFDVDDDDDINSCSSFSLQECIDEFRARRIRRISTQSREAPEECTTGIGVAGNMDPADADLINQNRSNKEHERKCKPCENGFCYCFTSDSGDGGCATQRVTQTRVAHVRQHKRNKKPENNLATHATTQQELTNVKEKHRQSAPANLKIPPPQIQQEKNRLITPQTTTYSRDELTAISRLETSKKDAPLIHIIQELHNNCVISEVRVNRHKIRSRSLSANPLPKKTQFQGESTPTKLPCPIKPLKQHSPSAPELDEMCSVEKHNNSEELIYSSPLNTSSKSSDSPQRKHKAGGLLLQKRLSHTQIHFKPRNLNQPPPKPPRSSISLDEKTSISTLASTSPSVRAAEEVLDAFLRQKGVTVAGVADKTYAQLQETQRSKHKPHVQVAGPIEATKIAATKREQRKSYPLTQTRTTRKAHINKPLPTCPSLSDIERVVDTKKQRSYAKNMHNASEKPVKEHRFGWVEPKITEMLNCDISNKSKEFKSRAVQAEPQSIGWQVPHKIELDTVDGNVRQNLASNVAIKHTPVKTQILTTQKEKRKSSWSNVSPWTTKQVGGGSGKQTKSSLKSTSRKFLNNSKQKILRLVSPKKHNKTCNKMQQTITQQNVGVQTSRENLHAYVHSSTPQSPPGSYHSTALQSQQSSSITPPCSNSTTNNVETQFDFSRIVQSPPKKATRNSQRKLHFPVQASNGEVGTLTKTYRSYHSDLDQDATLSKMGYILGNIRAKLEASDDHAVRTFQEIEQREQRAAKSVDCIDGPNIRIETRIDLHRNNERRTLDEHNEPIYSEIEEDSIHISGSPQFDNSTGIEHFHAHGKPDVLYAKVNKMTKEQQVTTAVAASNNAIALGQLLHNSMRNKQRFSSTPLPTVLEPTSSSDASYASPTSTYNAVTAGTSLTHCQSLNNIRVMEQHSPPKKNRNLSKSDLSLQHSEIFLDNLCRGEIIVERGEFECLEKVNNSTHLNRSYTSLLNQHNDTSMAASTTHDDSVSYELPLDDDADTDSNAAGNVSLVAPSGTLKQSTPKKHTQKQTYITKSFQDERSQLSIDIAPHDATVSCPNTPHQPVSTASTVAQLQAVKHATSLNELYNETGVSNENANSNCTAGTTLARYKRFKNALRKSLRKSKDFMKMETKRLSTSLNLPLSHASSAVQCNTHNQSDGVAQIQSANNSTFHLDLLFALDEESTPVSQQLAHAVYICRQLPDLEISPEMVEAERLLLFSTLRREAAKQQLSLVRMPKNRQRPMHRVFVDAMQLPVQVDPSRDIFFNYFYICTFECDGVIKSTQSAECCNNEAWFHDCGIEFACDADVLPEQLEVQCQIFMLRLRKVSTLALEPRKPIVKLPPLSTPSPTHSSSSSGEEIVSRFRLHASFKLKASDFVPYECVEHETKNTQNICLRASSNCCIAIARCTRSTNLSTEIRLVGRTEIRFPKVTHSGFLNVQDPHSRHNWNRRWCTLEGFSLHIWHDINDMKEQPLLTLDLSRIMQATTRLTLSPRELCARARSFYLQCAITKATSNEMEPATAAVFFAADTQADLEMWLQQLNAVLVFIATWLQRSSDT